MLRTLPYRAAPWALLLAAAAPCGLAAANADTRDPLNPGATVAPSRYESPFKTYRRLDDVRPTPWKDANDTVHQIGGWRSYAREANAPEPAASAPATAPKPAAAPPAGPAGAKR